MAKTLDELFQGFVPVKQRSWYPWRWPKKEWYQKTRVKNPSAFGDFVKKVRHLASTDLYWLADNVLRDPDAHPYEPDLHGEMAWLAQIRETVMIIVARNHWKTTLCTTAGTIQRLGNDPNYRMMIGTAEPKVQKALLEGVKQQIEFNERLHLVFPDLKPAYEKSIGRYKKWNNTEILVERTSLTKKEPSITAMTVGVTNTGLHFDEHRYDDIVTSDNASTRTQLETINSWYFSTLDLLDVGGSLKLVGTPYDDGDIYSVIEEMGEIPIYRRPAIEEGRYIFPYQEERVKEKKRMLPAYQFAAQYMCDPISTEDQRFKPEWFQRWNIERIREELLDDPPAEDIDCLERWLESLNLFMSIDPAWKSKKISDFMVVLTLGMDTRGRMFVVAVKRGKWPTPEERKDVVYKEWLKYRHRSIGIETYGGGAFVLEEVKSVFKEKNQYVYIFEYEKPFRQGTEEVIMKMQMPIQEGIIVLGTGEEYEELENELVRFPHGRHDDILAAMGRAWSQQVKKKQVEKAEVSLQGWRNTYGFESGIAGDPYGGNYSWMAI